MKFNGHSSQQGNGQKRPRRNGGSNGIFGPIDLEACKAQAHVIHWLMENRNLTTLQAMQRIAPHVPRGQRVSGNGKARARKPVPQQIRVYVAPDPER